MIRFVLALIVAAAVIGISVFFANHPGEVSIVWQGWRIETSFAVLVVVAIVTLLAIGLIWSLLRRLLTAPSRYLARRREARRLQGYRDLTRGLVAIAAGDGGEADKHHRRAAKAFRKGGHDAPPLSLLLSAQAAMLRGEFESAKHSFDAMLNDTETAFLGYRGLIMHALRIGDEKTALHYAEKARRLRPGSSWVLQQQLALEARAGDWRQAEQTLRDAVKRDAIDAARGRHIKTALSLARSQQAVAENRNRDALNYAAQAHGLNAGFAPAAIHYAALLRDASQSPKALRIIETAWSKAPHPALAKAYDSLLASNGPAARARRFERLVDIRPADPESHLAAAAVALSAQLWAEAGRHLDRAGAQGPGPWSGRLCQLMADLERARQHIDSERLWLERARRAPHAATWICDDCDGEAHEWSPTCPHCQSFASLQWREPGLRHASPPRSLPGSLPGSLPERGPEPLQTALPS